MSSEPTLWRGSCVTLEDRAVLIQGASGSGKSELALHLMALGATLVADDGVLLSREGQSVIVRSPESISGLIEARGIGLLRAKPDPSAALFLVVDLDETEDQRLPPLRQISVLGLEFRLIYGKDRPNLAYGLIQILKSGQLPKEH